MFIFQDGEYISNNGDGSCLDQFMCFYYRDLNKEVEIIEDEEIDKLIWFENDMKYVTGEPDIENIISIILDMQDKINEIIDKLNEMEKE